MCECVCKLVYVNVCVYVCVFLWLWLWGSKNEFKILKPSLPPPPLNHLQIRKTNVGIESLSKTVKWRVEIDYTVSWSFATDPTIAKDLFQNLQARIEFPWKHQERWNTSYSLLEKLCRQVSSEKFDALNQQCLENISNNQYHVLIYHVCGKKKKKIGDLTLGGQVKLYQFLRGS